MRALARRVDALERENDRRRGVLIIWRNGEEPVNEAIARQYPDGPPQHALRVIITRWAASPNEFLGE